MATAEGAGEGGSECARTSVRRWFTWSIKSYTFVLVLDPRFPPGHIACRVRPLGATGIGSFHSRWRTVCKFWHNLMSQRTYRANEPSYACPSSGVLSHGWLSLFGYNLGMCLSPTMAKYGSPYVKRIGAVTGARAHRY